MDRRTTLKTGIFASVGTLLAQTSLIGAGPYAVASGLSTYSSNRVTTVSEGSVHIRATIDNLDAFMDTDARKKALPYEGIRAEGNLFIFEHRGLRYTVENIFA